MKTESNIQQPKYTLEPLEFGRVRVTLNAHETKTENGYTYDSYTYEAIDRPNFEQAIAGAFDEWVNDCEKQEIEKAAMDARLIRNKLIAETDYIMCDDYPIASEKKRNISNIVNHYATLQSKLDFHMM